MSAAIHSRVHMVAAFVTRDPLGLSVIAQVSAVTLSPRRAMLRPALPSNTCPRTDKIAPIN